MPSPSFHTGGTHPREGWAFWWRWVVLTNVGWFPGIGAGVWVAARLAQVALVTLVNAVGDGSSRRRVARQRSHRVVLGRRRAVEVRGGGCLCACRRVLLAGRPSHRDGYQRTEPAQAEIVVVHRLHPVVWVHGVRVR